MIGTTGGVLLATAAFAFFRHQAKVVVTGRADHYDGALMDLVHRSHSERLDRYLRFATALGEHMTIGAAAYVTALTMMKQDRKHDAWTVLISTGGAMVLNSTLKAIFQRQRPIERQRLIRLPRSHSFPSGHSLLSAATWPIVAHHLVQGRSVSTQLTTQLLVAALIGSVGYSRVYFGVHFPSDVLAGFAAGFGWLGLTALSHTAVDREVGADRMLLG
jgi:membrane-associated phospholipid phosphatase